MSGGEAEGLVLAPGDVVGSYVIQRHIGQGGMGTVFLGRDTGLDRPTAIKFLGSDLVHHEASRQRFVAECRLLARLSPHPHIVTVYARGEHRGMPYFAMEYVEGESLKELMRRQGRLGIPLAVRLIRQVAEALSFVWASVGVVHRDVKPSNIMVDRTGSDVKVMDFGLAKCFREGEDRDLTHTGIILGTPDYLAPEQARGDSTLDCRTDMYSLGATLFHLVAGRPPFSGRNVAQIVTAHLTKVAPRLSLMVNEVPADLDDLVVRMLAKDPRERPSSYDEIVDVLRSLETTSFRDATQTRLASTDGGSAECEPEGDRTIVHQDDTSPSGGGAIRPRLFFGYDDAFFIDSAGEVCLEVHLDGADGDEQDIKLTLEGDIRKPFVVNLEDRLGSDIRITVTPTAFPAARIVFRLTLFDGRHEPHCWVGETLIRDVERPYGEGASPRIQVAGGSHGSDGELPLQKVDSVVTLKRRRLEHPVRAPILLHEDDETRRFLSTTSRENRIRTGEVLHRARRRVEQGRLEEAYELIREVEALGFFLREVQTLKRHIQQDLSLQSLQRGRELFRQGRLSEAQRFLGERKLLCFNQDIVDLLMDIEDIGADCARAAQLIDEGVNDEVSTIVESLKHRCPHYPVVAKLESRLRRMRDSRSEGEDPLCGAVQRADWKTLFDEVVVRCPAFEHDCDGRVHESLTAYVEAIGLRPLAKIIQEDDEAPHLILVAEDRATIGRHVSNTILLNDSTRRTSRCHGTIVRVAPGRWMIHGCDETAGGTSPEITVDEISVSSAKGIEIVDGQIISFSDTVLFRSRVVDCGAGGGIELAVERLPAGDEGYRDVLRWYLFHGTVYAGGGATALMSLPGYEEPMFSLSLFAQVFWLTPTDEGVGRLRIDGEIVRGSQPLFWNQTLELDGKRLHVHQLRACEELWLYEDELRGRQC